MDPGSIPGISTKLDPWVKPQGSNALTATHYSFPMIEIRPISPSELDGFLEFMDGPAFATEPKWQGCYCQTYLNTKSENEEGERNPERNRQLACDRIASNVMQGYVAIDVLDGSEKVVGWMAANSFKNYAALPPGPENEAAIICFVVDKDYQGRGVATRLLSFGLADLPKRGYVAANAAPLASGEFFNWGYRGPRSMFEKAGFEAGPMLDDKHVLMRKSL